MKRASYPPDRATAPTHRIGSTQVKTRYAAGCEPWLRKRAWTASTPATTAHVTSPTAARHR